MDPGALLAATHQLGDGARVRLRLTRPSDAQLVRDFLAALSPVRPVSDEAVRRFTFYDPRARLAIAATMPIDGAERIVGLADAAFSATGPAEIGVVVDDERQYCGLGTLLSEAVESLALQRGRRRNAA